MTPQELYNIHIVSTCKTISVFAEFKVADVSLSKIYKPQSLYLYFQTHLLPIDTLAMAVSLSDAECIIVKPPTRTEIDEPSIFLSGSIEMDKAIDW